MEGAAATIDIDRPVGEVFAYVADFTNDPQWRSEVSEIVKTSSGPVARGATYTQVLNVAGKEIHTDFELTEFVFERLISFVGRAGAITAEGTLMFSDLPDDRTRVAFVHRMHGPWWFKLMEPWLAARRARGIRDDLWQLRGRLTAPDRGPAGR